MSWKERRNIIVIGASAGGFEAIRKLVSMLPENFDACIFIVWHMSPDIKGILPQVVNRVSKLPAVHGRDKELIKPGHIYIAPPDHHLLLEKGWIRITRGPKENNFRPAVDPLFRSAAYAYGPRVIGIILSGALDDGSAGLWTIKQRGGIAMVQDPEEAEVPSMPENALNAVTVDYKLSLEEMPSVLMELTTSKPEDMDQPADEQLETEIKIAMEDESLNGTILQFGDLTPYTCPECHGVLAALKEGSRLRFRCHTGHAFSADSLLASITGNIEERLWSAIRNIQESVMLLNHMGDHFAENNHPRLAAMYFKKAKEAEERARIIRRAVFDHEKLSLEGIRQQSDEVKK